MYVSSSFNKFPFLWWMNHAKRDFSSFRIHKGTSCILAASCFFFFTNIFANMFQLKFHKNFVTCYFYATEWFTWVNATVIWIIYYLRMSFQMSKESGFINRLDQFLGNCKDFPLYYLFCSLKILVYFSLS